MGYTSAHWLKSIIEGIENLDEDSFDSLWKIAHPRKAHLAHNKWEEFRMLNSYKEKELWLAGDKVFLHYVEAYCIGYGRNLN